MKPSVPECIYPLTFIFSTFASDIPYDVKTINMQLLHRFESADLDLKELPTRRHHNPRYSMNCRGLRAREIRCVEQKVRIP